MPQDHELPKPITADDDVDIVPDATVELSFDEGALDLQALADEVAESTAVSEGADALITQEMERSLEEARLRIQELEKHEQEYLDKHHRLLADFSNYRNRTTREIQMAVDQETRKTLLAILPVLDNFDRSLEANYTSLEAFQEGVALIQKLFQDSLRKLGVEGVELAIGDAFDAQFAEALTTMQNPALPDGAIAAVYEKGYRHNGMLLRPARVVVNSHPHEGDADAPAASH